MAVKHIDTACRLTGFKSWLFLNYSIKQTPHLRAFVPAGPSLWALFLSNMDSSPALSSQWSIMFKGTSSLAFPSPLPWFMYLPSAYRHGINCTDYLLIFFLAVSSLFSPPQLDVSSIRTRVLSVLNTAVVPQIWHSWAFYKYLVVEGIGSNTQLFFFFWALNHYLYNGIVNRNYIIELHEKLNKNSVRVVRRWMFPYTATLRSLLPSQPPITLEKLPW